MKTLFLRTAFLSGLMFLVLINTAALGSEQTRPGCTKWACGVGKWTEAALWSQGLPNSYQQAEVHGTSAVVIPAGRQSAVTQRV